MQKNVEIKLITSKNVKKRDKNKNVCKRWIAHVQLTHLMHNMLKYEITQTAKQDFAVIMGVVINSKQLGKKL